MEVKIKDNQGYVDAEWTIEDGVMVVSPKEVKFEPKDGDIVNTDGNISIFKEERGSVDISFSSYVLLSEGNLFLDMAVFYKNRRPATEEEKQKLFDRLAEKGWGWNPEKKELVKLKWKPKMQEVYFFPRYVEYKFETGSYGWTEHSFDVFLYNKGWCFKTEAECQAFCDKLNEMINQVKP